MCEFMVDTTKILETSRKCLFRLKSDEFCSTELKRTFITSTNVYTTCTLPFDTIYTFSPPIVVFPRVVNFVEVMLDK